MNKKEASAKQEKMVSDYMGWRVVTGSGSRPFSPGDVNSTHFLVECKTHVEEQSNIVFRKTHWGKIVDEATSKHRYPALMTDNGTQKPDGTWVMIPIRLIPSEDSFRLYGMVNTARKGTTITFNHRSAFDIYKATRSENLIYYFADTFNGESLAIMSLYEFRKFYKEQFEL